MPEDWRQRVQHMLARVGRIRRTLEGIDYKHFVADDDKFSAVMAHFMI